MSFTAHSISIPETATPSISWSFKEHKMREESRKNKIHFYNFSDKIRHAEQILNNVNLFGRDIERAYLPRLFGGDLWDGFMPGQFVVQADGPIDLGDWINVSASDSGMVTATTSDGPTVIGRVTEVDHEIEHGGKITTKAKIALK